MIAATIRSGQPFPFQTRPQQQEVPLGCRPRHFACKPRSEGHLDRLLFIRHARDLGFEIEDVRGLLDLASQPDQSSASVDAIAKAHVSAIDAKIQRLTALRAELARTMRACSKGKIAHCK